MASRGAPSISKPHNSHTNPPPQPQPRTCLCSPTTHPGSFRCSMHKKHHRTVPRHVPRSPSINNNSRHRWESSSIAAKAYSLKAFLLQVIKPSSHDLHRRKNFQPKPTRFCLMNGNRDAVAVS